MPKVRFWVNNEQKEIEVGKDITLLEAVSQAGIHLNSICGGDGICGKCKVIVKDGEIDAGPTTLLTREEVKKGYVLACQTRVLGDTEVEVPIESRVGEGQILIDEDAQRFKALQTGAEEAYYQYEPLIKKYHLELPSPDLKDNLSDHRRLYREIRRKVKFAGNTSIIGVQMALISQQALEAAQEISESVTYYDLIDYLDYFDEFMAAKFLPHTDSTKFSSLV